MQNTSGCSRSSSGSHPAAAEHKGMGVAGSNFIAGVFLPARKEKLSIWEAMRRGLLSPGTALVLLEAQAASGLLTEPAGSERLSVRQALARGLIGHDFLEKLLSAEGAVTGYSDPYTGQKMSLFQAMGQGLILRDHGIRLLQAQIATGGIIDPERGHRVPVEVARERGYLDQEMSQVLSDPQNQTRSCFDPNTHENLTYLQLLRRCVPDPDTGLLMLQLMDKGSVLHQLSQDARTALQAARTALPLGLFQGTSVSLWELLFSRYVPEQRRQELLRQYKAGTVTIAELMELLTAMVTRAEAQGHGANVATKDTEREVLPDPVQNGSDSKSQKERELKRERDQELEQKQEWELKREFKQEQGQELEQEWEQEQEQKREWELKQEFKEEQMLEREWEQEQEQMQEQEWEKEQEQMQELERSLRSHTLEVSAGGSHGSKVSLWELLFSRYVPDPQREELLREYRAGTVTVAEMIELLTALLAWAGSENGALRSPAAKTGDEVRASPPGQEQRLRKSLKSARVRVTAGESRGRDVSVLDLLFSGYVPQGARQELLELYRAGVLSTEQVATVVTNAVTRAEAAKAARSPHRAGEDEEGGPARLDDALKAAPVAVPAGELQGRRVSLWELLCSQHIPEEKRQELLQLYREGFLTLELMTTVVSALIMKKESTGRKFHVTVKGSKGDDPPKEEPWETTLKTTRVDVEAAEFRGRRVSLWELLHCRYIPEQSREELLELYRAGELSLEQVRAAVSTMVSRAAAARAGPGEPGSDHRAGPGEPGNGHRAGPGEPGNGHGAELVGPGSDHRAGPGEPGSDHRAEPVTPGSAHRAGPVTPGNGHGAEPGEPGSDHRAEPVTPGNGHRAGPVTPGNGHRAEPGEPGSDHRAGPGEPGSDHRAEPGGPGSDHRAELVGPGSGHRAGPGGPGSDHRAEPGGPGSGHRAGPGEPESDHRAELVGPGSDHRAEPGEPGSGHRAEPVAREAELSPLHGDRAREGTLKATTAQVSLGELQDGQGSLRELLSSQHIPEERRQELLELSRGGTPPLQELPSTSSSLGSPLPLLTVDLLRSEGSRITLGPCPGPCQAPTVSVWDLLSSRRVSEFRREARLETFPRAGLRVKRITVSTSISSELRHGGDSAGTGGTAWRQ